MAERPEHLVVIMEAEEGEGCQCRIFSSHWLREEAEDVAKSLNLSLKEHAFAGVLDVPETEGILRQREGSHVAKQIHAVPAANRE
jgi:hypothetical protein